jgi:LAO/AO transport system kinase
MPDRDHHDLEHQQDMTPGTSALKVDRARGSTTPDRPTDAPPPARRRRLSVDDYVQGILAGDRAILGRAITLIESNSPQHIDTAQQVLTRVMGSTGTAHRIGITGVPGAGKSTFIETFGCNLTTMGHKVAVLAVDPSSGLTGGSVLGDKTRMVQLGADRNAFIRPSPSGGTLGGVARKTRETMLVCEAAGYDVILVETVGVGQSETVVADMTDFFLVIMIAGAGDELQGIKRGVLELADLIAVNKADGDNEKRAMRSAREYANALHYMHPKDPEWVVPALTCSALTNSGLDEIWTNMRQHRERMTETGKFEARRIDQLLRWMWSMVDEQLRVMLKRHPQVKTIRRDVESQIMAGTLPPTMGAYQILSAFGHEMREERRSDVAT